MQGTNACHSVLGLLACGASSFSPQETPNPVSRSKSSPDHWKLLQKDCWQSWGLSCPPYASNSWCLFGSQSYYSDWENSPEWLVVESNFGMSWECGSCSHPQPFINTAPLPHTWPHRQPVQVPHGAGCIQGWGKMSLAWSAQQVLVPKSLQTTLL